MPEPRVVLSIDAMGGDQGPKTVIAGLDKAARKCPGVSYIVHGPETQLAALIGKRPRLAAITSTRHAEGIVSMTDRPSHVMRHGKGTSMWSAINSLREGDAHSVVSCGNTGALMALSMVRLRKLEGVNRPAIACMWPSRNSHGFNIVLDVGADIRADEDDLLQYALMGASYARNGLGIESPRVGLLNVGTEEHKGRAELRVASELLSQYAATGQYQYVGYVEGGDIPSALVDVIVTDGFTGNIALKTGEGTATLIRDFLKEAFRATPLSRVAALLAYTSLRRLNKRIDPRRVNGGVFLGLNGAVVKSHGSADATGVAAAVKLAYRLAASDLTARIASRLAQVNELGQDEQIGATAHEGNA